MAGHFLPEGDTVAADPIDIAVKRAEAAAVVPTRISGQIKLPSGEVAVVNLPAPFVHTDALALVYAIADLALKAPQEETPEQAVRKRLVLPG